MISIHTCRRTIFFVAVILSSLACHSTTYAQTPALEYQNQKDAKPFRRSAIITSDRFNYWDFQFDKTINDAIGTNFKQIVFDFNQCYGGGMIDELTARNYSPAAYTSAARHDQTSIARSEDLGSGNDPNFGDMIRRIESTYNLRWAPAAGSNAPAIQRDAATTGRAQDVFGPFRHAMTIADPRFAVGNAPQTNPQYTSSGATGDNLRLHRGDVGTKYRAILFGGSTQLDYGPALKVGALGNQPLQNYISGNIPVNYNTLLRTRENLLAAGYTDAEMWIMYPGGHVRDGNNTPTGTLYGGGPVIPDWVDAGTRYNDLTTAWATWMKGETDQNTQIFYWSSWGHGNSLEDAKAQANAKNQKIPKLGTGLTFNMDADLGLAIADVFNHYKDGAANPAEGGNPFPYFVVETTVLAPEFTVSLNSIPLPLVDLSPDPSTSGAYRYKFGLSEQDIANLNALSEHDVVVNYDFHGADGGIYDQFADFITLMGPTVGDFANGVSLAPPVPEPSTCVLVVVGAVASIRGRRGGAILG